jgi:hypothetical protein
MGAPRALRLTAFGGSFRRLTSGGRNAAGCAALAPPAVVEAGPPAAPPPFPDEPATSTSSTAWEVATPSTSAGFDDAQEVRDAVCVPAGAGTATAGRATLSETNLIHFFSARRPGKKQNYSTSSTRTRTRTAAWA